MPLNPPHDSQRESGSASGDHSGRVIGAGLPLILMGGFLFVSCCVPLADHDFWWHLRTGELILARGELPEFDWYTFTDADKPWIDLHWGFQLLITAVWKLGGANLFVLVKAAVYSSAILVAMLASRSPLAGPPEATGSGVRLSWWQVVILWLLPAIAITGRALDRPEMLSLLFLAAWLFLLERCEHAPRNVWWLVPVQLAWTNCHALSVLGLVTGACFAVDWGTRALLAGRARDRWGLRPVRIRGTMLLLAGTAVVGTAFANPWLEEGAFFPLVLYRKFSVEKAFYSRYVAEFLPPIEFWNQFGPANLYLNCLIALWLLTAISFGFAVYRGRWSPFRLLMFAGFSHLAWAAARNLALFSLVAGVILCWNARDVMAFARRTSPGLAVWRERLTIVLAGIAGAGLCLMIALVVTNRWSRVAREPHPFGLGEREHWFAHAAMRFAGREGMPKRAIVFHNALAGVYIYHNAPERRVFMDSRLEVSTRQTFERYLGIESALWADNPSWTASLRDARGDLPVLVLGRRWSGPAIASLLETPGWRLVFADRSAAVFLEDHTADDLNLPKVDDAPLWEPF